MSADKTDNMTVEVAKENVEIEEEKEQHCLLFPTYATKHSLDKTVWVTPNKSRNLILELDLYVPIGIYKSKMFQFMDSVEQCWTKFLALKSDSSKPSRLTDDWNIRIRGWAFSSPKTSRSRDLFIGLASRIAGIKQADARYELLKDRTTLFWATNIDKEEFVVKVVGITNSDKMTIEGDPSDPQKTPEKVLNTVNEKIKEQIEHPESEKSFMVFKPHTGNFSGDLSIKQEIVNKWIGGERTKDKSIVGGFIGLFVGKDPKEEKEPIKLLKIEARRHNKPDSLAIPTYSIVNLVEPEGYSVISDIDDTIKQTEILDGAKTVFSNTFLNDCKVVNNMPDLYHKWYNKGVAIHYVSNSPWQLFPMLRTFFDTFNFPPGSAHLKFYDGLFKSAREQKQHPMESKFVYIRELLRDFPQRKFILVGDTGEYDPEIYSTIYRENPTRILRIFVRDVTTEHIKDEPAQSPHLSYAQTFTSTYNYLKNYYKSPEGKADYESSEGNDEHEDEPDDQKNEPDDQKDEPGDQKDEPHKPKRQNSLSSRLMNRLHVDMSSIYTSIHSSANPDHRHELPADVSNNLQNEPTEKLKTPLEMFHERIEKLKKGIPDGIFSTFMDPAELENDPIIKNALKY
ncbi:6898_t:CDS:10 [Dentiscutata heterogama]|uniref:6898_t:CDS:1 n=1 Tax=Dentiscutata heterogama TaxID=1316150 RepID=A0ACA9K5S2_9GLOM|nr:6898_t:CDS:10 [Dentiscutata heterogama]